MDRKTFYVTTPIYYVNAEPHIGHAFTTILADVLARHHRMLGVPSFFLTGTDEHGQKVQQAADKIGVTPNQHADETVVRFAELWKKLHITNDDFIRTTEERHYSKVKAILQDLYDRDEIYLAEYDGWYCVTCERFFTEKDLVDGNCPEESCGRPVEKIKESNYFFRMSKYQDWLIDYINEHPEFIQPGYRRNETLGFLRNKLTDLCISRPKSRLSWGIELPFDKDFVTYVWFDALCNYITAIGYPGDEETFSRWWPATYQLIGKDILTTHTVYWPTMLKAIGLPMPRTIFAHGWWLAGDSKMSKTEGNVVRPMDFVDEYGLDAFRYFLLAEMALGQDASFTRDAFVRRYNSDLANDLGNLLSRVVKMISSYCSGIIPEQGAMTAEEESLRDTVLANSRSMIDSVEGMRIDLGLAAVMASVREANKYLERCKPWSLAKEGDSGRLGTVLYSAAEVLRVVSGLMLSVMPGKMTALREQLGIAADVDVDVETWGGLPSGVNIATSDPLFPRIAVEDKSGPSANAKPAAAKDDESGDDEMTIEYDDFMKVKLRTAKVLVAEKVEGADKLLRLEIEVGDEKRQIVAGIAQQYEPESLVGKTIVVVANLKPAKIRGVESNGMLLAASTDDGALSVVTLDGDLPSGATVR